MFFNKSPDYLMLKSNNYNHTKNRYNVSHKLYFLPCFPPEKSPFVKVRSFHTVSMSTMLYRCPRLQQGHRRTVKSPGSAESPTSPFYYGRSHCNSPIFHYMIKQTHLMTDLRIKVKPYIYIWSKNITCIVLHVPTSRLFL